MILSS
jgi:hypothetical protein